MSNVSFDERLLSASHSLLSKNLAEITVDGTIRLLFDEFIFLPLMQFDDAIQVIITIDDVPVVTNIHIHQKTQTFTAHRVRQSVVHQLWNGEYKNIVDLILEWISMKSLPSDWVTELNKINCSVSLAELAKMQSETLPNDRFWLDKGLPKQLAQQLAKDVVNGGSRGSIVMSRIASAATEVDTNKAGPGVIFWEGKNGFWGVQYHQVNDNASGILFGCKTETFRERLNKMLGL
jgi:hypothetical protein